MASPTAHGTLTANVVETVEFDINYGPASQIVITHRGDSGNPIWYTLDGSTPVAEADGTYLVTTGLPVASHRVWDRDLTIKLLSTSAVPYSVMAY